MVVGTPGRALDHVVRGSLDLSGVTTVVVDEADRMLEMGFGAEMEKILSRAPKPRQTVLFSATYPRSIDAMTEAHQHDPERLTVGESEGPRALSRQVAYVVDDRERRAARTRCWRSCRRARPNQRPESTIVFCNFKATVARVEQALRAAGVSSASLHGNLEQRERDFVMAKFRNHSMRVLVATDVAARGLDIEGLDLVVNFELPFQPEIYVHRIGRTGRAGKAGLAVSLVGPQDRAKVKAIEAAARGAAGASGGARGRPGDDAPTRRSLPITPRRPWRRCTFRAAARTSCVPATSWVRSRARRADFRGSDVGKIEIHERFSYVAIARGARSARLNVSAPAASRARGSRWDWRS